MPEPNYERPAFVASNPKPEPHRKAKGRAQRAASKVEQQVRAFVSLRDGDCRVGSATTFLEPCWGNSEWAHLGEKRRSKTRGQAPEVRHTSAGSLMLCTWHHNDYDEHRMDIEPLTEHGANGTLRFVLGTISVLSVPAGEKP